MSIPKENHLERISPRPYRTLDFLFDNSPGPRCACPGLLSLLPPGEWTLFGKVEALRETERSLEESRLSGRPEAGCFIPDFRPSDWVGIAPRKGNFLGYCRAILCTLPLWGTRKLLNLRVSGLARDLHIERRALLGRVDGGSGYSPVNAWL